MIGKQIARIMQSCNEVDLVKFMYKLTGTELHDFIRITGWVLSHVQSRGYPEWNLTGP